MKEIKHTISQKVFFFKWYKWVSLFMLLALLLCLFFKCCNSPVSFDNDESESNTEVNDPSHSKENNNPGLLPNVPNRPLPIDNDKIVIIKDDPLQRKAVSDLVNVYLEDTVNIQNFSFSTLKRLDDFNMVPTYFAEEYKRIQFQVNEQDKSVIMDEIRKDSLKVKFVTHEWVYTQTKSPTNDPGYADSKMSWFYESIGLFDAWNYTRGSDSVVVAVLDDGFDLNHPELKNKYTNQWNVAKYTNGVYATPSRIFHGTHVAGSVIGEADNNFGISGVAPGCLFMPVQISDESGIITITSILDGIFYALKNKADVINLSLALSLGNHANLIDRDRQEEIRNNFLLDEEQLWNEVFEIVEKSNTIIVQAAGNDKILSDVDPMKRSLNSIVVGALDENMNPADFTNYGDRVTVYAPGKNIYSSLPDNNMGFMDGTSMASPIVAGCVALIRSYKPNLSVTEVRKLIEDSASKNNKRLNVGEIFNRLI